MLKQKYPKNIEKREENLGQKENHNKKKTQCIIQEDFDCVQNQSLSSLPVLQRNLEHIGQNQQVRSDKGKQARRGALEEKKKQKLMNTT